MAMGLHIPLQVTVRPTHSNEIGQPLDSYLLYALHAIRVIRMWPNEALSPVDLIRQEYMHSVSKAYPVKYHRSPLFLQTTIFFLKQLYCPMFGQLHR